MVMFTTSDVWLFEEMLRLLKERKMVALCTIIEKEGHGPRNIGAKMIISENGNTCGTIGGGYLERVLIDESLKALKEGKPTKVVFSLGEERDGAIKTGLICGGELTIFIDVIKPKQRLIIVGAGHVGQPLAKLADIVGFSVVIVDDNEKLANKERFPMAEKIITGNFKEIMDKIEMGSHDFVVIVHGEPEHDYLALEKTIRKSPTYIGLLGSEAKVAMFVKKLKDAGVGEEKLKLLHAPVGLNINAQTPEEIAISILAEIVKEKNKHSL